VRNITTTTAAAAVDSPIAPIIILLGTLFPL
jgi:hypothetical protein